MDNIRLPLSIGVVLMQDFTHTLYDGKGGILRRGQDFVCEQIAINTHHNVCEGATRINPNIFNYQILSMLHFIQPHSVVCLAEKR